MSKLFCASLLLILASGCANYTVTKLSKNSVAVAKNSTLLGGIWPGPKVYVCKFDKGGLSGCVMGENP